MSFYCLSYHHIIMLKFSETVKNISREEDRERKREEGRLLLILEEEKEAQANFDSKNNKLNHTSFFPNIQNIQNPMGGLRM